MSASIEIAAILTLLNRWILAAARPCTVTLHTQVELPAQDSGGAPRLSMALALQPALANRQPQVSHLASLGTGEHLVTTKPGVHIHSTVGLAAGVHTQVQAGCGSLTTRLGQEEEADQETGQEEFHLWSCLGDGVIVT